MQHYAARSATSMSGYKKILVALDLGGEVDLVLERARRLAAADAEVAVVHVLESVYLYSGFEPGIGVIPDNFEAELLERATRALDAKAERFGIPAKLRFIEHGHAPTQILMLAKDRGCDLIVVGSHGKHGWRLLLGSTANAVLHTAACDVLAVRTSKA
jgi:universal stress protein A